MVVFACLRLLLPDCLVSLLGFVDFAAWLFDMWFTIFVAVCSCDLVLLVYCVWFVVALLVLNLVFTLLL